MTMIAGGGFALMAWRLAQDRRWHKFRGCVLERHQLGKLDGPSTEYYRIIDKALEEWLAHDFFGTHELGIRL